MSLLGNSISYRLSEAMIMKLGQAVEERAACAWPMTCRSKLGSPAMIGVWAAAGAVFVLRDGGPLLGRFGLRPAPSETRPVQGALRKERKRRRGREGDQGEREGCKPSRIGGFTGSSLRVHKRKWSRKANTTSHSLPAELTLGYTRTDHPEDLTLPELSLAIGRLRSVSAVGGGSGSLAVSVRNDWSR